MSSSQQNTVISPSLLECTDLIVFTSDLHAADINKSSDNSCPAQCLICHENFRVNDILRRLRTCEHLMHANCLDRVLCGTQSIECPLCSSKQNIHPNSKQSVTSNPNHSLLLGRAESATDILHHQSITEDTSQENENLNKNTLSPKCQSSSLLEFSFPNQRLANVSTTRPQMSESSSTCPISTTQNRVAADESRENLTANHLPDSFINHTVSNPELTVLNSSLLRARNMHNNRYLPFHTNEANSPTMYSTNHQLNTYQSSTNIICSPNFVSSNTHSTSQYSPSQFLTQNNHSSTNSLAGTTSTQPLNFRILLPSTSVGSLSVDSCDDNISLLSRHQSSANFTNPLTQNEILQNRLACLPRCNSTRALTILSPVYENEQFLANPASGNRHTNNSESLGVAGEGQQQQQQNPNLLVSGRSNNNVQQSSVNNLSNSIGALINMQQQQQHLSHRPPHNFIGHHQQQGLSARNLTQSQNSTQNRQNLPPLHPVLCHTVSSTTLPQFLPLNQQQPPLYMRPPINGPVLGYRHR